VDDVIGPASCDRRKDSGFSSASLSHVGSALFIYLSGVAASMVLLLCEIAAASGWFAHLLCGLGRSDEVKKKKTQDQHEEKLPWPVIA